MADALVKRAYSIEIQGFAEAKENLEALTKLISSLDAAKRKLNTELNTKISIGDAGSIEALQKQIKALEDQIKNLDKTREKSAKELETLAKAEKLEADAKLASAKASTELIKGDALRSASIIAQERELDRLIAIEEKEEQARLKANAAANTAIKPANTTGTNTTNTTNNTTAGLNVNANTGAANDSLTALRATLKALESEFNNLSLSSSDYSEKSKILSDSIRSTKIEIAQLTESTKVSRAETISLASSLEIEAGSYKDVLAQLRELRPFVQTKLLDSTATVDFRGQTLGIVEATAKFKELSVVEQDFRRQFAKDSLLVGEYSSGIIKAFKELGVTDIFKKQKDDINSELNSIKSQNQVLAEEYKRLATESTHALDQISTSLKQNTTEQTNLSKSIHTSSGQQKIDFENQLAELQKINAELKAQFDTLKRSGGEAFDKLSNDLKENIALQEKMRQSLGHIDDAIEKSGTVGSTFTKSISEGFKDATSQLKQLVLGYIGFQAVFSGVVAGIGITKELSDQTTNLEVELGKAKGGVKGIIDELAKLDTRTQLTELTNIANIAAKAGVDEKNIVGVTKAIDEIKIAFGKDFGDVEQGTESLVKLVNVFEGTKNVNEGSLLKVGNAIRTLANETVASVPFLNDFSKRMAGLEGISKISLPAVLGLASGFEQFGQSSEVAGTTLTRVIPKLATDTEKYGKIAGLTQKAFSDLLKDNPAEALIKVSEGLVKSGQGIEDISKNFADSQLGSGRIAAVLGTIGAKADDFRKSIKSAGDAYNDTSNITTAFTAKNENLAATIDKISKSFADAANSTAFRLALTAIAGAITLIIGNLGIITAALGVYVTVWGIANAAMIRTRALTLLSNLAFTAQYAQVVISQTITRSYAIALEFLSTVTGTTAAATTGLGVALRLLAGPIGIILAVVGLTILSFKAFGQAATSTTDAIRSVIKQNEFYRDSLAQAREAISETISKETTLVAVINSHTASEETKKQSLKDLIALNPTYLSGLTLQNVALSDGKAILDAYNNSLLIKAQRQAADAIKTREYNDLLQAQTAKMDLERLREEAKTKKIGFGDLTDEQKKFFPTGFGTKSGSLGISDFFNEKVFDKEFDDAIKNVNTKIREKQLSVGAAEKNAVDVAVKSSLADKSIFIVQQTQINNKIVALRESMKSFDGVNKTSEEYNKKVAELNVLLSQREVIRSKILGTDKKETTATDVKATGGESIEQLKKELEEVNAKIEDTIKNETNQTKKLNYLKILRKQRIEIIRQINELGGTTKTTTQRPDRLSVDDQNKFKDIDAARDNEITDAKRLFALRYIDEKTYLNDVLVINQEAIRKKLTILDGSNAEERRKIGQLHLERITDETETNKKLFDLYAKDAENRLTSQTREAKKTLDNVNNNPDSTFTQRNKAQQDYNISVLTAQTAFNNEMNSLEIKFNQKSESNELKRAETIGNILKDIRLQRIASANAELADMQKQGDDQVAKVRVVFEAQRKAILESKRSTSDKNSALTELDKQENISILTNEIATMAKELPVHQDQLARKEITELQYADFYTTYVKKINDLNSALVSSTQNITNVNQLATSSLSKLFGFAKGSDKEKLLGETIAQSFQLAQSAMNDYFDAEKKQLDQNKQLAYDKIDLEKQQLLATAQSQAERDSIEKQALAKRKDADKKAFEENKKIQIAQAEINLATQLSNLAVIAFAPNPLNILTLGAAGAVMYGIQAAIALAGFALNVSRINKATAFAGGGLVNNIKNLWSNSYSTNNSRTNNIKNYRKDEENIPTIGSGRITMAPNIERQANGDNVLAHVPVGHVILNERQQSDIKRVSGSSNLSRQTASTSTSTRNTNTILATVKVGEVVLDEEDQKRLGGPVVFKKIGVPGFADGGIAQTLGGTMIGSTLIAPSNPSLFLNSNSSSNNEVEKLSKMIAVVADNVNSVNNRITNLKVINVVTETDRVLQDNKKANNIGTL